jgi:polysaccharide biosynthesis protein PelC
MKMTLSRKLLIGFGLLLGLTGCAAIQYGASPALSCTEKWIVLPFQNYSEMPQAGQSTARLVENALRAQGVKDVGFYSSSLEDSLIEFSLTHGQYEKTLEWAKWQNAVYGITGSVTEWRYKNASSGEPAAGLTLSIIDVKSGKTIWSASGSKTGWSSDALSGVALQLVKKLISATNLQCQ